LVRVYGEKRVSTPVSGGEPEDEEDDEDDRDDADKDTIDVDAMIVDPEEGVKTRSRATSKKEVEIPEVETSPVLDKGKKKAKSKSKAKGVLRG